MIQELLYTSAPKGLKPGSRGFCTVLSTSGMPAPVATALESLSGYRPVYPPGDPQAKLNPVVYSHLKMSLGGRRSDVLSRVADYGLDYSQRTNKIAHHLVVDSNDRPSAGPAWLLAHPDVMRTSWEGEPHIVSGERLLPNGKSDIRVCSHWKELTGDAGWAGVLAESFLKKPDQPAYIVFSPGMNLLPLIEEALALLPASKRWDVSFSTYFTKVPNGVTCNWRCVLADSPEAKESRRYVQSLRIDLTEPLGPATGGELVEAARTGRAPIENKEEPLSPPAPPKASQTSSKQIHLASDRPQLQPPAIKSRTEVPPIRSLPNKTTGWTKWIVATVVLILVGTSAAYFAGQAPVVVTQAPPLEQHAPITPPEAPAPAPTSANKHTEITSATNPMPVVKDGAANPGSPPSGMPQSTEDAMGTPSPPISNASPSAPMAPMEEKAAPSQVQAAKVAEQPTVIYFDLSDKDPSKPMTFDLPFPLENQEDWEVRILIPTFESKDVSAKGSSLAHKGDEQNILLKVQTKYSDEQAKLKKNQILITSSGLDKRFLSRTIVSVKNKATGTESFILFSSPPMLVPEHVTHLKGSFVLTSGFPNGPSATKPQSQPGKAPTPQKNTSHWTVKPQLLRLMSANGPIAIDIPGTQEDLTWDNNSRATATLRPTKETITPIIIAFLPELNSNKMLLDEIIGSLNVTLELRSSQKGTGDGDVSNVRVYFTANNANEHFAKIYQNENTEILKCNILNAIIQNSKHKSALSAIEHSVDEKYADPLVGLKKFVEHNITQDGSGRLAIEKSINFASKEEKETFIAKLKVQVSNIEKIHGVIIRSNKLISTLNSSTVSHVEIVQFAMNEDFEAQRYVPFLSYSLPIEDSANPN